jgi:hypothetical protein
MDLSDGQIGMRADAFFISLRIIPDLNFNVRHFGFHRTDDVFDVAIFYVFEKIAPGCG